MARIDYRAGGNKVRIGRSGPKRRSVYGSCSMVLGCQVRALTPQPPQVNSGIVVGFDGRGYPLVDAHSSDRYHVPFDINWDSHTVYYLWHVHYPQIKQS